MIIISREETNRIKYIIALVAEFAAKFSIGEKQAFNYLKRFKEMAYLSEFYDVLHTLSFEETVSSLAAICNRNGGKLMYGTD